MPYIKVSLLSNWQSTISIFSKKSKSIHSSVQKEHTWAARCWIEWGQQCLFLRLSPGVDSGLAKAGLVPNFCNDFAWETACKKYEIKVSSKSVDLSALFHSLSWNFFTFFMLNIIADLITFKFKSLFLPEGGPARETRLLPCTILCTIS